mmetsp:Transcript_42912/g.69619  ORF Transcript_42912/g.69619 Transcript_42912/m.69619 type:complete len:140 (+) Transcript_42912:123-542(+)
MKPCASCALCISLFAIFLSCAASLDTKQKLVRRSWANTNQTLCYVYFSDGNFTSVFNPPCLRSVPKCSVAQVVRSGGYSVSSTPITLKMRYKDGKTTTFALQFRTGGVLLALKGIDPQYSKVMKELYGTSIVTLSKVCA